MGEMQIPSGWSVELSNDEARMAMVVDSFDSAYRVLVFDDYGVQIGATHAMIARALVLMTYEQMVNRRLGRS